MAGAADDSAMEVSVVMPARSPKAKAYRIDVDVGRSYFPPKTSVASASKSLSLSLKEVFDDVKSGTLPAMTPLLPLSVFLLHNQKFITGGQRDEIKAAIDAHNSRAALSASETDDDADDDAVDDDDVSVDDDEVDSGDYDVADVVSDDIDEDDVDDGEDEDDEDEDDEDVLPFDGVWAILCDDDFVASKDQKEIFDIIAACSSEETVDLEASLAMCKEWCGLSPRVAQASQSAKQNAWLFDAFAEGMRSASAKTKQRIPRRLDVTLSRCAKTEGRW